MHCLGIIPSAKTGPHEQYRGRSLDILLCEASCFCQWPILLMVPAHMILSIGILAMMIPEQHEESQKKQRRNVSGYQREDDRLLWLRTREEKQEEALGPLLPVNSTEQSPSDMVHLYLEALSCLSILHRTSFSLPLCPSPLGLPNKWHR